ncbi:MAG: hypothetical protein HY927_13830 [Elusimicrobia bacterium]|nr:hypothetical protein [Elusimicrobiota bacterium]
MLHVLVVLFCWGNGAHAAPYARSVPFAARPSVVSVVPVVPALSMAPALSVPLALTPSAALPVPGALPAPILQPAFAPALHPSFTPTLPPALAPASRPADASPEARGSLETLADPRVPAEQQSAALGGLFDGSVPILGGLDRAPAFDAQSFASAYGLYRWVSALPQVAASPDPRLAAARLILDLKPLLDKGPVIIMKDAGALTALCADDPSVPPVVVSLAAADLASAEASPRAAVLAGLLTAAALKDEADPGRFHVAQVLNNLSNLPEPGVSGEGQKAKLEPVEDIPLDPVRQPQPYLERMLRDAMRSDTPDAALAILRQARDEAKRLLNYQDRSRFLARLRSHGELLAGQYLPGILDDMQLAAADNDKRGVESLLASALEFVVYAPGWEKRVLRARETAVNTMAVLDRFGPIDEKTGLPVPKEDPQPQP